MDITINDQDYTIKFSYRVISALLKKLGIKSLSSVGQLGDKLDPSEIHSLIHVALKRSMATKSGTLGKVPSEDEVVWAIDEDMTISSRFITGFLGSLTDLLPSGDTSADLEEGK